MQRTTLLSLTAMSLTLGVNCGEDPNDSADAEGTGGTGEVPTGGAVGASASSGGVLGGGGGATGGASAGSGPQAGGRSDSGGRSSTGGSSSGGGPTASGGSSGGGADATGGTDGSSGGESSSGGFGAADCMPPPPGSMGTNPLLTDTYTADPAPMVHDCTFYIACGHDEGTNGFFLREWYVLSSTDMVHWERKIAFGVDLFDWANANAWASQMVEKDGTFYWYVPVQKNNGTMAIGVAKAESPEGPFVDAIGGPLVDDDIEMANMGFATPVDTPYTIDPTVFVDDDGRVYMHYGSFFRMINAELDDDMISIKSTMRESTPQGFFEAPFLTKRDGVYYEVYARDGNPAKIDYSTSESPMGPWRYGGRILDPLPNNPGEDAATSHPGIAVFAGQWYLVYHLSHGSAGTYRRQVAVEKLTFNEDGSIQKVTPSDGLTF